MTAAWERADHEDELAGAVDGPVPSPAGQARRERLLPMLDVGTGRGLEIGALCDPVVTRAMADVRYVDVDTTEGLREHYRDDPSVPASRLVEVDVPLYVDGRLRSMAEATSDDGPFAWAVACHVVEHVPDMVGWLADVAASLEDGGRLGLVVPDRRYTFDARRPATTVGQLLEAHERGDQRPSVRAVYDHFSATVTATAHDLWRGAVPGPGARANPPEVLTAVLQRYRDTDDYIDCHVWVVDPQTFVAQLAELSELGLLDFVVEQVITTPVNELEFYVVLRRLPRSAPPGGSAVDGFACPPDESLPVEEPSSPEEPASPEVLAPGVELRPVTGKEWSLITGKRRVLAPVVTALQRWRSRRP